jgi:hypothetical protein
VAHVVDQELRQQQEEDARAAALKRLRAELWRAIPLRPGGAGRVRGCVRGLRCTPSDVYDFDSDGGGIQYRLLMAIGFWESRWWLLAVDVFLTSAGFGPGRCWSYSGGPHPGNSGGVGEVDPNTTTGPPVVAGTCSSSPPAGRPHIRRGLAALAQHYFPVSFLPALSQANILIATRDRITPSPRSGGTGSCKGLHEDLCHVEVS